MSFSKIDLPKTGRSPWNTTYYIHALINTILSFILIFKENRTIFKTKNYLVQISVHSNQSFRPMPLTKRAPDQCHLLSILPQFLFYLIYKRVYLIILIYQDLLFHPSFSRHNSFIGSKLTISKVFQNSFNIRYRTTTFPLNIFCFNPIFILLVLLGNARYYSMEFLEISPSLSSSKIKCAVCIQYIFYYLSILYCHIYLTIF